MADDLTGHEATILAAVKAVQATLDAQFADIGRREIVLTRDEALLAAGLIGSLPDLIKRNRGERR